jgi:hypothetical protein
MNKGNFLNSACDPFKGHVHLEGLHLAELSRLISSETDDQKVCSTAFKRAMLDVRRTWQIFMLR